MKHDRNEIRSWQRTYSTRIFIPFVVNDSEREVIQKRSNVRVYGARFIVEAITRSLRFELDDRWTRKVLVVSLKYLKSSCSLYNISLYK